MRKLPSEDDTTSILLFRGFLNSIAACRDLTAPAGQNVCHSPEAIDLDWVRRLPGLGFPADSTPAGVPNPHPNRLVIRVGYSLLAVSRLGYSPKLPFNAAYHITPCKSRGITNQFYFTKNPPETPDAVPADKARRGRMSKSRL